MHDKYPKVDQDKGKQEPHQGVVHPWSFVLRIDSFFVALPAEGHPLTQLLPNQAEVDSQPLWHRLALPLLAPGHEPSIHQQLHLVHLRHRQDGACRDRLHILKCVVL